MPYRLLADAVIVLHLAFIAFAAGGGLLAWHRPAWALLHLPALAWGAWVAISGGVCPLTPLENALRVAGGGAAYSESFIERYLLPIVYPGFVQGDAGRGWQIALGLALVVFNAVLYALLRRRRRHSVAENRAGRRQAQP